MRLTITTKYEGPTDTRGSRIVARGNGRRLTQPYRYELGTTGSHEATARDLAREILGIEPPEPEVASLDKGYTYHFRVDVVAPEAP